MKTTRQGVRDLDAQYGKVKKKPMDDPPVAINCKHDWRCLDMGIDICKRCKLTIDHMTGEPI